MIDEDQRASRPDAPPADGDDDASPRTNRPAPGPPIPTPTPAPASKRRGPARPDTQRQKVGDRVTIYRDLAVSRHWQIQYSVNGRQVRRSLKTASKARAETIAKQKDAQLVLGVVEDPDARPVTVAAARAQYLASLRTRGAHPRTLAGYDAKLRGFESFCARRHARHLRDATAGLLEAYQDALQTTGVVPPGPKTARRGPGFKAAANKPKTVRDKLKVVRQLLKWARARGLLRADPAGGYVLPPAVKDKAYCWTPAELRAVLDHAPDGFAELFDFLRLTGLRADELCWLAPADLSADGQYVTIRPKTCPRSGTAWQPKRRKERTVPLAPDAAVIAARAAADAAASGGPWLFPTPGAGAAARLRPARLRRAVKLAMTAGGVARGTTHTFRHAFCSFLARSNVPPSMIMQVMGHDSPDIMLQYCHADAGQLFAAVAAVPFGAMLASDVVSPDEQTRGGTKQAQD